MANGAEEKLYLHDVSLETMDIDFDLKTWNMERKFNNAIEELRNLKMLNIPDKASYSKSTSNLLSNHSSNPNKLLPNQLTNHTKILRPGIVNETKQPLTHSTNNFKTMSSNVSFESINSSEISSTDSESYIDLKTPHQSLRSPFMDLESTFSPDEKSPGPNKRSPNPETISPGPDKILQKIEYKELPGSCFLSLSPLSASGTDSSNEEERIKMASKYFYRWNNIRLLNKKKEVKAEKFFEMNTKFRALYGWRKSVERLKMEKIETELNEEECNAHMKRILATKYRDRYILSKAFLAWFTFSRIQDRKKKLIAVQMDKKETKLKVESFLESLTSLRKKNQQAMRRKIVENTQLFNIIFPDRAEKTFRRENNIENKKKHSLIHNQFNTEARIEKKKDLSSAIIESQRKKIKDQEKKLEELREIKSRLENNRPPLQPKILQHLKRKKSAKKEMQEFSKEEHEMEDNKECEETDEGTGKVGEENKINTKNNNMEVKEQEMPSDESEYNYSEDFEDDDEVHCSKKTPEILIKIQEKDKRRREKREQIRKLHELRAAEERERRRSIEVKKEKEAEEELRERRARWRQQRKEEMAREMRKRKEEEKRRYAELKADNFYNSFLIRRYGLTPWIRLLEDVRLKELESSLFHKYQLKRKMFNAWQQVCREEESKKESKAVEHFMKIQCKKYILKWKEVIFSERAQIQAADDFLDLKINSRYFQAWRELVRMSKRREYSLSIKSDLFYSRILKRKYFFLWLRYILLKESILESENTREFLRSKVSILLPDYIPLREN